MSGPKLTVLAVAAVAVLAVGGGVAAWWLWPVDDEVAVVDPSASDSGMDPETECRLLQEIGYVKDCP